MAPDFRQLLPWLVAHKVDFILVGGAAALAHGSARLTSNIHLVYSRHPDNLRHLVQALESKAPYLRGADEQG
jgi:hypothetical protein